MSRALPGDLRLETALGDLQGQIYRALRDMALDGRLAPGSVLPSTRNLARALGVARSTVVEALERLKAEGYLETRAGAAARIALIRPGQEIGAAPSPTLVRKPAAWPLLPLTPGVPDVQAFPSEVFARHLSAAGRRLSPTDLAFCPPEGHAPLRAAIARHLAASRGVLAEPDQVLILPSAGAGMALFAALCLKGHDRVWVEEPGYLSGPAIFGAQGAEVVAVPCDAAGLDPDLAPHGPEPRLICISPSHQFPTGATLSLDRRLGLLDLARRTGALILEDDYDSEFPLGERVLPALQSIDRSGSVVYLGTFSKVLAPSLRLAFAIAPFNLVEKARAHLALTHAGPAVVLQAALAEFINEGRLRAHIRRMAPLYAVRMMALRQALAEAAPSDLIPPPPHGGLQLAVSFCDQTRDDQLAARLMQEKGFGVRAFSDFHQGHPRRGLVFGTASATDDVARQAARAFTEISNRLTRRASP